MPSIIFLVVFSPFLALLPVGYAVYHVIRFGRREGYYWQGNWSLGLLLLFLWSLLVSAFNLHWMSGLASLGLGVYFLLSVYMQNNFRSEDQVERLFFIAFIMTLGSALIGVMEQFNLINRDPAWWKYFFGLCTVIENKDNLLRITGTFGNPNLAAAWYAVMVLVGYHFACQASGRKKVLILSGVGLCLAVLMMTESRGALAGLFLGILVFELMRPQRPLVRRIIFPLLGFLLMITFPLWCSRGDLLFSTLDIRQAIWKNCFNMFLKKPITGWGILGIYYADSNVYQYLRVLHAHNFLLSILVMLGSVGMSIFAWMEWSFFKDIRLLRAEESRLVPLLAGIHAVFIGHGLFDFTVMGIQAGILFMSCSALAGGLALSYNRHTLQSVPFWDSHSLPPGKSIHYKGNYEYLR